MSQASINDADTTLSYDIFYPGAFAMARVFLNTDQSFKSIKGAMIAKSKNIELNASIDGGITKGVSRKFSGETYIFQIYKSVNGPGEVLIAPPKLSDVKALTVSPSTPYIVQKNSFLASSAYVNISSSIVNLVKGFISREGYVLVKLTGSGTAFVHSYGAVHEIDIPEGEEVIVDNHHLVAWPANIEYHVIRAGKDWLSFFLTSETLAFSFKGPGKIYIQTRIEG